MTEIGKIKLKTSYGIGKMIKRMTSLLLGTVSSIIIISLAVLLSMSQGKIRQFRDESGKIIEGSLAEKCFEQINGVKMGMIIKSKDISNPVLLFVHGGPGMPEYFLSEQYPTSLDEIFTVVWWDQRGAGLSFSNNIDKSTITVEQYIKDTVAVTNYLRERFGQEKIYLMAHSWGSYFSIQAVQKEPQLYNAYIGVGQITYYKESERLAYEYMLDYYAKINDKKTHKTLIENDYLSNNYYKIRDSVMHRAGIGSTHNMKSVVTGIFFASLKNREYNLSEKINLWRGKTMLNKNPQLEMKEDLRKLVTQLDVPTYFFSGAYDYTVNFRMSENYLNQINAPVKGFYLFERSAHSPIFEEPDKVIQIFKKDILKGTNKLYDSK
mgnify:CR=1 FL=1